MPEKELKIAIPRHPPSQPGGCRGEVDEDPKDRDLHRHKLYAMCFLASHQKACDLIPDTWAAKDKQQLQQLCHQKPDMDPRLQERLQCRALLSAPEKGPDLAEPEERKVQL